MEAASSGHDLRTADWVVFTPTLFCRWNAAAVHQSHALQIAHRPLFAGQPTLQPIHGRSGIHNQPGAILIEAEVPISAEPAWPRPHHRRGRHQQHPPTNHHDVAGKGMLNSAAAAGDPRHTSGAKLPR
jgi:hypothetical protein